SSRIFPLPLYHPCCRRVNIGSLWVLKNPKPRTNLRQPLSDPPRLLLPQVKCICRKPPKNPKMSDVKSKKSQLLMVVEQTPSPSAEAIETQLRGPTILTVVFDGAVTQNRWSSMALRMLIALPSLISPFPATKTPNPKSLNLCFVLTSDRDSEPEYPHHAPKDLSLLSASTTPAYRRNQNWSSSTQSSEYPDLAVVEHSSIPNPNPFLRHESRLWNRLMADKTMGGEREHDGASVTCRSVCAAVR
ncbi:unnamed protein product, partial [Linum tenue]